MKQPVLALGRNDRLSMAEDLLQQERIRHIPVLDEDGKLCGIVTQRDLFRGALLRALGYGSRLADKLFESLPIKEAMTDEVISTSPETPVSDAARLLLGHKIGCLPVTDNGKLVGIVTETDFIELAT